MWTRLKQKDMCSLQSVTYHLTVSKCRLYHSLGKWLFYFIATESVIFYKDPQPFPGTQRPENYSSVTFFFGDISVRWRQRVSATKILAGFGAPFQACTEWKCALFVWCKDIMCSDCCSVGRAVTSNTRDPRF